MLQLGTGTLRIMNMETGEDLGAINELPEVQAGEIVDKLFIGVDLCNSSESSITVEFEPKSSERFVRVFLKGTNNSERFVRVFLKGTNNWRKRHHVPMLRKIHR